MKKHASRKPRVELLCSPCDASYSPVWAIVARASSINLRASEPSREKSCGGWTAIFNVVRAAWLSFNFDCAKASVAYKTGNRFADGLRKPTDVSNASRAASAKRSAAPAGWD